MTRRVALGPPFNATLLYGPWWVRWWLMLTTTARHHVDGLGRPCVIYRDEAAR